MIKTLRYKFIATATLAYALILTIVVGGINFSIYTFITSSSDALLTYLAYNNDVLVPLDEGMANLPKKDAPQVNLTPESAYKVRHFAVDMDDSGQVIQVRLDNIAAVTPQEAENLAEAIVAKKSSKGWHQHFRYLVTKEGGITHIGFLDTTDELKTFHSLRNYSFLLSLLSLLAMIGLVYMFSSRVVKPVIHSVERQRQFITDAGHELKTPLAVISADADVLSLTIGENEWVDSIKDQTKHMNHLVQDLLYLAKFSEMHRTEEAFTRFSISDIIEDVAGGFTLPARAGQKELQVRVQPDMTYHGSEYSIRRLLSILLSNAIQYAPANSDITVDAAKHGRSTIIRVQNALTEPISKTDLEKIFERFYRVDASRTRDSGGHGIGLAMAKDIVAMHHGKIVAQCPAPDRIQFIVTLP